MAGVFRGGYLDLSRVQAYLFDDARPEKRSVRVHWTLVFGYFAVAGFQLAYWRWVGLTLLLIAHVSGHVFAAWKTRVLVQSVDVTLLGGRCKVSGKTTWQREGIVAAAGLLAQAALFAIASCWLLFLQPPADSAIRDLLWIWIVPNAVIAGANLLPFPTSDARGLWLLVQQLVAARSQKRVRDATHDARRSLEEADAAFARSENQADEIANDVLARVKKDL